MAPPLTSHTVVVAAYLMARGKLRMAQGQGKEALQDFMACGERCERLGIVDGLYNWRSEAAVTHAMLGNAAEARRLARKAVELARGFGRPRGLGVALRAAGLAEGVAGAKPRRDAITGRDALTAGELRVARLAAAGKTNREIAQTLFITTKTASAHLSRAYRKLDVTRRSQLADALASKAPAIGSREATQTR
jgi:DNA-binding CsgD family transcriptional regulator